MVLVHIRCLYQVIRDLCQVYVSGVLSGDLYQVKNQVKIQVTLSGVVVSGDSYQVLKQVKIQVVVSGNYSCKDQVIVSGNYSCKNQVIVSGNCIR